MKKKKRKRIIFIVLITIIILVIVSMWILWPSIKTPLNTCDWPSS